MPYFLEWLLVLFQPMEDGKLREQLQIIGIPQADGIIAGLYAFSLFAVCLLIRYSLRTAKLSWAEGEVRPLWCLAAGVAVAAALLWDGVFARMMIFLSPNEAASIWGYEVPSFHSVHRALLPFDISGLKEFLHEGNFQRKLKLSFFLWEEDSRGLYIYPLILLLFVFPGVRAVTAPAAAGALLVMSLVPLVFGAFIFSVPAGMGLMLVLFIGSGGLYRVRRLLLGKD